MDQWLLHQKKGAELAAIQVHRPIELHICLAEEQGGFSLIRLGREMDIEAIAERRLAFKPLPLRLSGCPEMVFARVKEFWLCRGAANDGEDSRQEQNRATKSPGWRFTLCVSVRRPQQQRTAALQNLADVRSPIGSASQSKRVHETPPGFGVRLSSAAFIFPTNDLKLRRFGPLRCSLIGFISLFVIRHSNFSG
jgi:hypothetical protein